VLKAEAPALSKNAVPSGETDTLGNPGSSTMTFDARVRTTVPVRVKATTKVPAEVNPTMSVGGRAGAAPIGRLVRARAAGRLVTR
jgi:hypothetical protein